MQFGKTVLTRPVHGGINLSELSALGLDPEDVIDFSANINPLGVSSKVKKAMSDLELTYYPDPDCRELRQKLTQTTDVPIENIIVGNGSTELIHLLSRVCLVDDGNAMLLTPTFGEYESACHLAGVTPVFIWAKEADDFNWDIADICHHLVKTKPQLVFLCNPNNPTGLYLDKEAVQQIAKSTIPGVLVIDEAYLPFVDNPWDSKTLLNLGNVVLLRSMTKDHALAGLRLGYAIAPTRLVQTMKIYQPFWSVNIAAQIAGLTALADQEHVMRAKKVVSDSRAYLCSALGELGIKVLPSSVNFILAKVGNAGSIRHQLLKQNLYVRDCSSFGLPQYIRIAMRTLPECQRLVEGLKAVWDD